MGQSVDVREPREGKQTMLDRFGFFALFLFNLVVLAGFGWFVLRVLRLLQLAENQAPKLSANCARLIGRTTETEQSEASRLRLQQTRQRQMRFQTEAPVGIWDAHCRRCSVRCRSSCRRVGRRIAPR